ncbi:MAG: hypothetical protein ACHQ15_04710 [Candidatus Limnocylindrales bacterium]
MLPLVLIAAGIAVCAGALIGLSRSGPGYRLGRMLSAAPPVALQDVEAAARAGRPYVRVHGRIASDEEFPDENDRPLVYRRRRLQLADDPSGRTWRTLEDEIQAVPFGLDETGAAVAIVADDLHEGLVVIPRESTGTAADAPDRAPSGTDPALPLRQRIEQISAVEHAFAAGRPMLLPDGRPALTAGIGRPLILTTLEIPEAMRLLAADRRRQVRFATIALGLGLVLVGAGVVIGVLGLLRVIAL